MRSFICIISKTECNKFPQNKAPSPFFLASALKYKFAHKLHCQPHAYMKRDKKRIFLQTWIVHVVQWKKGKVCNVCQLPYVFTCKVASWIAMGITDFLLGIYFQRKKIECQPFPMIFIKTHLMITYSDGGIPLYGRCCYIYYAKFSYVFRYFLYMFASFLEKIIAIKLESTEKIFGIKMYWTDIQVHMIYLK